MATEKQKNILLNAGWSEKDVNSASYEQISQAIGAVLAEKRPNPFKKEVKSPVTQMEYKPKFDAVSAFTRQATDLTIAMLAAHLEARKIDPKIQPIAVGALMTEAIFEVKKAKDSFEANK